MIKKIFKLLFTQQTGVSMLETLVGTAFIGLIILFGLKQSEIMGQSNLDTKIDRSIVEWHGQLTELFNNAEVCNINFNNKELTFDHQNILDINSSPLFSEGDTILNNEVKVNKIETVLHNNQIILNLEVEKTRGRARTRVLTKKNSYYGRS